MCFISDGVFYFQIFYHNFATSDRQWVEQYKLYYPIKVKRKTHLKICNTQYFKNFRLYQLESPATHTGFTGYRIFIGHLSS